MVRALSPPLILLESTEGMVGLSPPIPAATGKVGGLDQELMYETSYSFKVIDCSRIKRLGFIKEYLLTKPV